jgi:hypothetical protein
MWKYRVIHLSEAELERMGRCSSDIVMALRWIDKHQLIGDYEAKKAEFAGQLQRLHPQSEQRASYQEAERLSKEHWVKGWTNLREGTESPDKHERKRYEAAGGWLIKHHGNALAYELAPILAVIAKPKHSAGRKSKGAPSEADHLLLTEMKVLIQKGMKVGTAARQVAGQVFRKQSTLATQKRLEKWWRWKMELREFPAEFKSLDNLPTE